MESFWPMLLVESIIATAFSCQILVNLSLEFLINLSVESFNKLLYAPRNENNET